jgi:hypothetical protein
MKDAKSPLTPPTTGVEKKEYVIGLIKSNLPQFYEDHSFFIDIFIDTIILVSKNPTVIKAGKNCCSQFLKCLKCQ